MSIYRKNAWNGFGPIFLAMTLTACTPSPDQSRRSTIAPANPQFPGAQSPGPQTARKPASSLETPSIPATIPQAIQAPLIQSLVKAIAQTEVERQLQSHRYSQTAPEIASLDQQQQSLQNRLAELAPLESSQQALDRLVAEAQTAKMRDQFGERFDHSWSGEMGSLASDRGYRPDFDAFVRRFQPSLYAPWLIRDLIAQKRFAEADQRLKTPIVTTVDAGPHDHTEELRDLLAQTAARAGMTSFALQRAAALPQDAPRLAQLALALHQGGKTAEADRLFIQAQQAADSLSALPSAVAAQAAVLVALTEAGRSQAATLRLQQLAELLKTEPDRVKQGEILLGLRDPLFKHRQLQVQIADQVGLLEQPQFTTALGDEFLRLQLRDSKAVYALVSKPRLTPLSSLDFMLNVIELFINRGEMGGLSMLDMPTLSLNDGPSFASMPPAQKSLYFERIALLYLSGGLTGEAKNAAGMARREDKARGDRLLQRLSCY